MENILVEILLYSVIYLSVGFIFTSAILHWFPDLEKEYPVWWVLFGMLIGDIIYKFFLKGFFF